MFLWFALGIPFLTALVLAVFFHHRTKWWEFSIPFAISLLLVGLFKLGAEHIGTKDHETWNGWVLESRYYEDWNEYIHQTCSYQTCSGTGQNQYCTTHYYDCSYVRYHSKYWTVEDSNDYTHRVSEKTYHSFVRRFLPLGAKPTFVDMRRHYHTNDGDMYKVAWPKTPQTVEPVNTSHIYENRIQASRSVFNYPRISDEEAKTSKLFAYPQIELFGYPSILGDCGPRTSAANESLRYHNAMLGKKKELRMWLLCFRGEPLQTAHQQEAYWVGGNKNEFVLVVGLVDEYDIQWAHPFSWTKREDVKIAIRDLALSQIPFDPVRTVEKMSWELEHGFERRHFEEFSYLTVEPPNWYLILTFVLVLLANIGLSCWVIHNEFQEETSRL